MDEQIFSDGIGTIAVVGSTVRLDFVTLSPTERDANGQPKAAFRQRIIMSQEGFLRSAKKVQEAFQALSKLSPESLVTSVNTPFNGVETRSFDAAPVIDGAPTAPHRPVISKPPFP